MEEKRNYVIYTDINNMIERVVLMTEIQAKTIQWFMDTYDLDGSVVPVEDYEGEEIADL